MPVWLSDWSHLNKIVPVWVYTAFMESGFYCPWVSEDSSYQFGATSAANFLGGYQRSESFSQIQRIFQPNSANTVRTAVNASVGKATWGYQRSGQSLENLHLNLNEDFTSISANLFEYSHAISPKISKVYYDRKRNLSHHFYEYIFYRQSNWVIFYSPLLISPQGLSQGNESLSFSIVFITR